MSDFPEREWTPTRPPLDKYDGKYFASFCRPGKTLRIEKIGEKLAYFRHFPEGDEYYYGLLKVWWYAPIELPDLPPEAKQ